MLVRLLNRLLWLALIVCAAITVITALLFAVTANSPTLVVLEIDALTWAIFLGIFLALTITVWVCIRLLTTPTGQRRRRRATPAAVAKSRLAQFTGPMRPVILADTAPHPIDTEVLSDTRPGPPATVDEALIDPYKDGRNHESDESPDELSLDMLEAEILDDTHPNEITPPGPISDTTPHPKPIWEQYEGLFPPAQPGDEDYLELEQEIAALMPTMGVPLDAIDAHEAKPRASETPPDASRVENSSDDELTEDLPTPRPPDSLPT